MMQEDSLREEATGSSVSFLSLFPKDGEALWILKLETMKKNRSCVRVKYRERVLM